MSGKSCSALVEIGRIVAPHGIRGQVKVHVPDPRSSTLLTIRTVYVRMGGEPEARRVMKAVPGSGVVILALDGVADRTAAEGLRGTAVLVKAEDMPVLPAGEFYEHELVGMAVEDGAGRRYGTVEGVTSNGAQDLLVVRGEAGGEHLVPLVRGIIEAVDRAGKVVRITPIEGLFE